MSTPNLWWVYEQEDQAFSTLPTGPFLLPALIILSLSVLWKGTFSKRYTIDVLAGNLATSNYWQGKKDRYRELVGKFVELNGELSYNEQIELKQLSSYLHNPYGRKV